MDRRTLAKAFGLVLSGGWLGAGGVQAAQTAAVENRDKTPATNAEKAPPFRMGMIIFPGMTNLDFAGPNQILSGAPGAQTYVLGKTLDPIITDTGIRVTPDTTLRDCPELDLIFIGGGGGTTALMEDPEVINFLRSRAPRAKWITSVCTGALVLGAAGLLKGYKATTHWTAMDVLPIMGVTPVYERYVIDRNRISGGGVTAGIDFGLIVLAEIWGRDVAERMQLICEYDPKPPFNSGSPKTARPALVASIVNGWKGITAGRMAAAKRAAMSI